MAPNQEVLLTAEERELVVFSQIDGDLECLRDDGDWASVAGWLRDGLRGYAQYSDRELLEELASIYEFDDPADLVDDELAQLCIAKGFLGKKKEEA